MLLPRKILSLFFKASSDITSLFSCQLRQTTTLTPFPSSDFHKSPTLRASSPFVLPVSLLYSPKHCLEFKYLFIYWFLAVPHSMWDLSSPTRNQSHATCTGRVEL